VSLCRSLDRHKMECDLSAETNSFAKMPGSGPAGKKHATNSIGDWLRLNPKLDFSGFDAIAFGFESGSKHEIRQILSCGTFFFGYHIEFFVRMSAIR
jgi:hypothetical protein